MRKRTFIGTLRPATTGSWTASGEAHREINCMSGILWLMQYNIGKLGYIYY